MNDKHSQPGCSLCSELSPLDFSFTFAFQPVFDLRSGKAFSYEALVRGPEGQSAWDILSRVDDSNRYQFDQACRVKAVTLAKHLGLTCKLNINFLPNAVYVPEACIQTTLRAANEVGFPFQDIIFELVESEHIVDREHLKRIVEHYRSRGIGTAIDDFGAGYAGLGLLAEYQPDIIKLDMSLVRDIDQHLPKQAIVEGMVLVASRLNIQMIAEGVETRAEAECLRQLGIALMQGYYFARPAFEALPEAEPGTLEGW